MDYGEEDDGAFGSIPEFGTILNPWSETIDEVAVKDRRRVGRDRDKRELSERGYMAADEYYDIDNVAFSDRHVSRLARGKEDEIVIGDTVNAKGTGYPFPHADFLAKKRRIGEEGRLTTDNVAETRLYSHGYRRTFCPDSPKDSLDEVRRLANSRRLLAAQMVNENQLDKTHNPVQSSYRFMDQLNVGARDDYVDLQRSTLLDDNIHNDYQQGFASDHYGDSLGQGKHVISEDRFVLDNSVKRNCNFNAIKSMANSSDDSLNIFRPARDRVEEHEWLINKKLENRYRLDCDGSSSISAFDPSVSRLHRIRTSTTAVKFETDENELDFGTCVKGFSSRNRLHPSQRGYRNNEDRNYPIVDRRSTENTVNRNNEDRNYPIVERRSTKLATTAGYITNAERQTVDGRFRKRERVDNLEISHTHTSPVMSMKYPSFSQQDKNLSAFSDKLFPEKHFPKFGVSRNFDLPHSTIDDATITRDVSYLPDYPNYSHGCSTSVKASRNSTSMVKTQPQGGSLGNFYPLSSNRSQQYILESGRTERTQDSALRFGNIGFAGSTSGLQTSLPQESINSLVNPKFFMDMDLNTDASVKYRDSLSSRLSPSDLENFEGEKGLLSYYSKSRDDRFSFPGNDPETSSEHVNQHVPLHEMTMLAGKEIGYSESEDLGIDTFPQEPDSAIHHNQQFRFSSDMNLKELHGTSETNSSFNRRSVFTRLSSKAPSHFGEERNDIDVNHQDRYMNATADEVMEMLQQDDNLSLRKLRKSRVAGQSRETAVNEKRSQCNVEIDHSTMKKKKLKSASPTTADSVNEIPKEIRTLDFKHRSAVSENKTHCRMEIEHAKMEKKMKRASQTTAGSMDEIQKETRTLDFKRRSDRKNSIGIAADSGTISHSKPTGANEEVKSSTSSTLRRKKLVRPVFSRTDIAIDTTCSNEKLPIPAIILDKDDKKCHEIHESEIPNDITGSNNVLASQTCLKMDCDKELLCPEVQKDIVVQELPSTSVDLKGRDRANDDLHTSSKVPKETCLGIQSAAEGILAEDTDTTIKETSQQKILGIQTSVEGVLAKDTGTVLKETSQLKSLNNQSFVECILSEDTDNTIKETSQPKSSDIQTSVEGLFAKAADTSIKETYQPKSLDIPASVEGVLAEAADTTIKETSQPKSSDIQTSVEGLLAEAADFTIKETYQPKSLDIPASVEGVMAKAADTITKGTSQPKSSDIQTPVEGILVTVTDTTVKETSQQKSMDVQTSFEGILVEDADTTSTCLNLPESSLEGFKHSSGFANSLTEETHLTKITISPTTKEDARASSQ